MAISHHALVLQLDGTTVVASSLQLPRLRVIGSRDEALQELSRLVAEHLERLPAAEQRPFLGAGECATWIATLELPPPPAHPEWTAPLPTRWFCAAIAGAPGRWTLLVPQLQIRTPVVRNDGPPVAAADEHILRALRARGALANQLARLLREITLPPCEVVALTVPFAPASPRDAVRTELVGTAVQPRLPLVTRPLATDTAPRLFLADLPDTVQEHLARGRSVLLIGDAGTGKTTLVREVGARLRREGREVRSLSGVRLVAQAPEGDWRQATDDAASEAAATGTILHVENLFELAAVGPCHGSTDSVASVLLPFLQRGSPLALAEITPAQFAQLERQHAALVRVFEPVAVASAAPERLQPLLAGWLQGGDDPTPPTIAQRAAARATALHARFAPYAGQPGTALRLLADLRASAPDEPITEAAVLAAFARHCGLPLHLLDERQPFDLVAVRQFFAQRILGQPEAVDRVVDLIAQIRTDLARPGKPLASLLFVGPTGVGKTELAKALAEHLFGDAGRILRLDMSEFADPVAVLRLIGGPDGEGLLTARIREQPFAVLLLDEIEKADAQFFDLLLQILGEGRLSDSQGRVGWFRQAVVVMTSNLGAESLPGERLAFGARLDGRAIAAHYEAAVRRHLRPELWNRIDAMVTFRPLGGEPARQILRLEIDRLARRLGGTPRSPIRLLVDDDAIARLADDGLDPRYGARPLQRHLDATVGRQAAALLARQQQQPQPMVTTIAVHGRNLQIDLRRSPLDATEPPGEIAAAAAALRRLAATPAAADLARRLEQIAVLEREFGVDGDRGREASPRPLRTHERQLRRDSEGLRGLQQDLQTALREVQAMEEAWFVAAALGSPHPADWQGQPWAQVLGDAEDRLSALLLRLATLDDDDALVHGLLCFGPDQARLQPLATAATMALLACGLRVDRRVVIEYGERRRRRLACRQVAHDGSELASRQPRPLVQMGTPGKVAPPEADRGRPVAVLLSCHGPAARLRVQSLTGAHAVVAGPSGRDEDLVFVVPGRSTTPEQLDAALAPTSGPRFRLILDGESATLAPERNGTAHPLAQGSLRHCLQQWIHGRSQALAWAEVHA